MKSSADILTSKILLSYISFTAQDFGKGKYRISLVNNELLIAAAVIAKCAEQWRWHCHFPAPFQTREENWELLRRARVGFVCKDSREALFPCSVPEHQLHLNK